MASKLMAQHRHVHDLIPAERAYRTRSSVTQAEVLAQENDSDKLKRQEYN
jgi:hypothetical protein